MTSAAAGPARADGLRVTSCSLLGLEVHRMSLEALCAAIEEAVVTNRRDVIGNHNLHSVYLCHTDPKMHRFYQRARYAFIDGMSLVLVGRLLGLPLRARDRITAVDWLRPMLRRARARGWRVFCLGSRPEIAARAAAILRREIPGLQLEAAHGYFDVTPGSEASAAVLARLRAYRPHVLIVGMGMPRQEHWIVDHLDQIAANAILNQGAFLDYVAGAVSTPPRWMGRLGLEWLARLAADPRRLWRRYLVEPMLLAAIVLRARLLGGSAGHRRHAAGERGA